MSETPLNVELALTGGGLLTNEEFAQALSESKARSRRMRRFVDDTPLTWEYVRERLDRKEEGGDGLSAFWHFPASVYAIRIHCDDPGARGVELAERLYAGEFTRIRPLRTVADLECALHLMRWDDA